MATQAIGSHRAPRNLRGFVRSLGHVGAPACLPALPPRAVAAPRLCPAVAVGRPGAEGASLPGAGRAAVRGPGQTLGAARLCGLGAGRSQRLGRGGVAARSKEGGQGRQVENIELIVGDVVSLWCLCLYKQVTAIVVAPEFGGWLSEIEVNWVHISEFLGMALTVILTWGLAAGVTGGYETRATAGLPVTIRRCCAAWLISQPAVLLNFHLVSRPMALAAPYDTITLSTCVLGVMLLWRSYYCLYLDMWNGGSEGEARMFWEAATQVSMLALACLVFLQVDGVWVRGFLGWGFGS